MRMTTNALTPMTSQTLVMAVIRTATTIEAARERARPESNRLYYTVVWNWLPEKTQEQIMRDA